MKKKWNINRDNGYCKAIQSCSLVIVLLFVLCIFEGCDTIGYERCHIEESPSGENRVIIKYDMVSRPFVFQQEDGKEKQIWSYPKAGFMETVYFEVEWLSESSILLSYDTEEYTIILNKS